ncbi:hypothetical protein SLEP1_g59975 [Rubroshorea leprosula]|uniref:Uncharacterized protein n=1 Tax=Rubroshorea leprosula TaxID=152421 RepID=A0AAV5MX56_9ROSI|nr:hypothetical protein SLEP1_g59975 [Rubroshorea leprosula]
MSLSPFRRGGASSTVSEVDSNQFGINHPTDYMMAILRPTNWLSTGSARSEEHPVSENLRKQKNFTIHVSGLPKD